VTEDDIISFVSALPGVDVLTAGEENGAPEAAWGDSFMYYDPDLNIPADRRFPFATIVVSDYEGFDTESNLNRPGVFRLNINVGRQQFEQLIGHPPAAQPQHQGDFDYAVLDTVLPHPAYGVQGWVSILNPAQTAEQARSLLADAHTRAVARHRTPR